MKALYCVLPVHTQTVYLPITFKAAFVIATGHQHIQTHSVSFSYYCYICQFNPLHRSTVIAPKDPPQLPGNCPESDQRISWIPFRGHCYTFMISQRENWDDATVECMRMGETLLCPPN